MKTHLAWLNVVHNKFRTIAAVGGVAFAILLMFMQLGIYAAAETSALIVYNELEFDVLVTSPQYVFLSRTGTIARSQLQRLEDLDDVESVTTLNTGFVQYRNPQDGLRRGMLILGIDPEHHPFAIAEINDQAALLHERDSILLDRRSRGNYGKRKTGEIADIQHVELTIVGQYNLGPGFIAGADAVVSQPTFRKLFRIPNADDVNLGFVKLAESANADQAKKLIRDKIGSSAQVFTRPEIEATEQHYFLNVKPIGIMFRSGVLVAFLVGAVTLYQILSTEVTNRLGELATLKAMGYSDAYVYWLVVKQGFIFAGLGYAPAFVLALVVYLVIRIGANVPAHMTLERAFFVLLLTCLMCAIASMFALRKVRVADPADLF